MVPKLGGKYMHVHIIFPMLFSRLELFHDGKNQSSNARSPTWLCHLEQVTSSF